jgi:hypothetical protein
LEDHPAPSSLDVIQLAMASGTIMTFLIRSFFVTTVSIHAKMDDPRSPSPLHAIQLAMGQRYSTFYLSVFFFLFTVSLKSESPPNLLEGIQLAIRNFRRFSFFLASLL